jgi:channel protein (hemolysin III family)
MTIHSIPGFSEPVSSLLHLLTAFFFLVMGSAMIYRSRGNPLRVLSLISFVLCGVFLFSMSGVYHLLEKGSDSNYVLRILDHAGIYLMIAGTFTPFQIILLRNTKRWLLLFLIWALAITGLTLTSIFFDSMPESMLLSFFISMGWMSLFTVWFIRKINPFTVKLIFTGGLFYTLGAIVDFIRWPNPIEGVVHAHEIFHLLITIASLIHFYAIFKISTLPISKNLVCYVIEGPHSFSAYFKSEKPRFEGLSLEDIQKQASSWVQKHYPNALAPTTIKYKLFYEEQRPLV